MPQHMIKNAISRNTIYSSAATFARYRRGASARTDHGKVLRCQDALLCCGDAGAIASTR
jgi:hypothetical protein